MLGHDRAVGAGDLGAAQDGTEILGILNSVEGDQQRRIRVEQLLQGPVFARLELCGDALVHAGRHLVEPGRRHGFDSDESRDLDEAGVMADSLGLIDPDHSSRTRGLENGVSPVDELFQTIRMVADFMAGAREMLAAGVTEERLRAVGELLSESSREPGFFAETEMHSLHGGTTTSTILQSDSDGLTLMLARFAPEETPVHNHHSWGVACVVAGEDRYRHWRLDDDGHVRVLYEKVLGPGEFVVWLDPPHDVHSQQGIGGTTLELVLFGKNVTQIEREYYDPETGKVRTALPQ